MKTFESNPWSVRDILTAVGHCVVELPEFQREFVWPPELTKDLIISISQQHPVGTLLFCKGTPIPSRPVEERDDNESKRPADYLILDGQQRITSLYHAFKGRGKYRFYVKLDVLKKNGDLDEDSLEYEKDKKFKKQFGEHKKQFENNIFPLECLLSKDYDLESWLDDYVIHKTLDVKQKKELRTLLKEKLGNMIAYDFPVISLLENNDLESICKIFENTNLQGLKLSTFEILTATLYPKHVNLKEKWETAKENNPLISKFFDDSDTKIVLKTINLVNPKFSDKTKTKVFSCKRTDMLKLTSHDIENFWDDSIKYLEQALGFLKGECGLLKRGFLPFQTILPPMAAALYNLEKSTKGPDKGKGLKIIQSWYWHSVFTQRYDSASDSRSAADIAELKKCIENKKPLITTQNFQFDQEILNDVYSLSSAIYKGLICLLVRNGAVDFYKNVEIKTLDLSNEDIEDHHIFPRAYLESKNVPKPRRNNIINKTLIDARTNESIGKNPPSVYFKTIGKSLGSKAVEKILRTHKLGVDRTSSILQDNFDSFFEERKLKFKEMIDECISE